MKKHVLALAASAAFFMPGTQAQTSGQELDTEPASAKIRPATRKGTIVLGSSVGLANVSYASTFSSSGTLTYDVQLSPGVGIFVTDRLLLSATLSGGSFKDKFYQDRIYNHTGSNLGIGISARYYFGNALHTDGTLKKLRFFAEAGGGYVHNWDKYVDEWTSRTTKHNSSNLLLRGGAGMSYFLNRNVSFDAGLNYNRIAPITINGARGGSLQIQLGFKIFLNGK